MNLNCNYNSKDSIQFYTTGISTCGIKLTAEAGILPAVNDTCCKPQMPCYASEVYDLTLTNQRTSTLSRALHQDYLSCEKILIIGTFTVDTDFTFYAVDASFAPNAIINVEDSSYFQVEEGACPTITSHLHAACDTMWRGIFIHPGSSFYTTDDPLIEDADTAIFAMNSPIAQGVYHVTITTFNKNWKNIVVQPYNGTYLGWSGSCIYTCRNYDSILASPLYNFVNHYGNNNWCAAPFDTLLYPHAGEKPYLGWAIDTVQTFADSGANIFDNLNEGIVSTRSNITIYSDTFQFINSGNFNYPAIYASGGLPKQNTLTVGGSAAGEPDIFRHCTCGVYAYLDFNYINIGYNKFHFDSGATIFSPSIGIYIAGPMGIHSNITIDSNIMDTALYGIVCINNQATDAEITNNVIRGSNTYPLQAGIILEELGSSRALYSVKNNQITNCNYGVYGNDIANDTIRQNFIGLNDTLCASPYGYGIDMNGDNADNIINNTITLNYHNNPSDNFTGIYTQMCSGDLIICNYTNYVTNHMYFSYDQNFNIWNNTMTAGSDTANGISITNNTSLGTQARTFYLYSSDNQWIDSFHCRSWVDTSTGAYPINSIFYVQSGTQYNPIAGVCSPEIDTIMASSSYTSCDAMFMIMDMALLDTIANSKINYFVFADTARRISKHMLTSTLWNRRELLNNSTLYNFNDSISTTSLGQLMIADTSINSVQAIDPSILLSNVNAISPATNIETNIQTTAQILLQAQISNTKTLPNSQINLLDVLANKCPFTDGAGVYQARTLLAYYNGEFNPYAIDNCYRNRDKDEAHKIKKSNKDSLGTVSFNIYPNPNNGNFIIVYDLGNYNSGRVELYNQVGMKIDEFILSLPSGSLPVSNIKVTQGVYIYKVYAGDEVKKVGKVVIIR